MHESNKTQSIILTGESGAGKTITAQHLTRFLCNNSQNRDQMMEQANCRMKLLDIFGNAETPENPNSSRFMKFLKVLSIK